MDSVSDLCISYGGKWNEAKTSCSTPGKDGYFAVTQEFKLAANKDENKGADRESKTVSKDAMDKLSPQFLKCTSDVMAFGERKYPSKPEDKGRPNWMRGLSISSTIASMLRHAFAMLRGEDYDKETGLFHACHVTANAQFLHWFLVVKPEKYAQFDDRAFRENE